MESAADVIEAAARDGLLEEVYELPKRTTGSPISYALNFNFSQDSDIEFRGRDLLENAWATLSQKYTDRLPPALSPVYAWEKDHVALRWTGCPDDYAKARWVCETLQEAVEHALWAQSESEAPSAVGISLVCIQQRYKNLTEGEIEKLRKRLAYIRERDKLEFPSTGDLRPRYLYPLEMVDEQVADLIEKRQRGRRNRRKAK